MDLFSRYVFRQAAGSFLLILLTLTAIVWLATALSRLELLTAQGQSAVLFLKMTLLALPNLFALIAPNAFLLACLTTLDRLNGDSELIAMTASGAPIWRFAAPLVILASLVAMIIVSVNFYFQPLSARLLRSYVAQVRTDLISQVLRPGQFSSPEKGLTFHIADRALNGDLEGLVVHDEREPAQTMTILAKRGRIVKAEGGAFLTMSDGHIQRFSADRAERDVQIVEFEQYVFDISQFGPKSKVAEIKPRARYLSELINPDPDDPYFKRFPGKFRSELHNRFATPLYPFAYALIAIALLGGVRTVRQNRWGSVITAFGCSVGIRVAGLAAMNMLTLSSWAVALVYGIPLTAIAVSAWIASRQFSNALWPDWARALSNKIRIAISTLPLPGLGRRASTGGAA
jgi:lipopolysaccharide export system permease protein